MFFIDGPTFNYTAISNPLDFHFLQLKLFKALREMRSQSYVFIRLLFFYFAEVDLRISLFEFLKIPSDPFHNLSIRRIGIACRPWLRPLCLCSFEVQILI